jgi:DNA-directed RNA polymerase, mitochondrial
MNEIDRQKQIETDSIKDGYLRYCQNLKYAKASDSKPVQNLLAEALPPLAQAILELQLAMKAPGSQKLPKYGLLLLSLDHEVLALITLCILLNRISHSEFQDGVAPTLVSAANEIGLRCLEERRADCAQKREVDIAKQLRSRSTGRDAGRRSREMAELLDDLEELEKDYRPLHLGDKLITLAVQHAKIDGKALFKYQTVRARDGKDTKTTHRIALTEAAEEWLADHDISLASLAPVYKPMIVEPRPFTSAAKKSGYLVHGIHLLKRQSTSRARQMLKKADMTIVYSAINAIQGTAWRANQKIHRIMRPAWEAGHRQLFALPAHTRGITATRGFMAFRFGLYEFLADKPRFYFPHQLDHRGRAYPVPQLINPQLDDAGRAPLEFADGKPLGERGAYWLAVHLANCYGKNKIPLENRLRWVHENEREIIALADNSLGFALSGSRFAPLPAHRFWLEGDKKKRWMFLAACLEWKGYREQGPGFISHLPVSMDGSCNGYQHLSAMGLDRIGGSAVNLLPEDEPQDMYQEVADHVIIRLIIDSQYSKDDDDREAALELLGKISRALVKHATMTTPYGVTRARICKELLKQEAIKSCKDPEKCARYLARQLEECIPEVAVEASNIMKWARQVATHLANLNRGMAWTTPSGFPVLHEIHEAKAIRVATADHSFVLREQDERRKIDVRKQADGIVAHLVHSFDAAHMMLTVNRLYSLGIRHFAMVHDSFGVHAADVDLLHRVLREEFVRIYSEPVLVNFLRGQLLDSGTFLPALPAQGNLDIQQVLESTYFFA